MFGLIDCNHFYVSCERVFNPRLEKKPVIVMTGEDGCIVARSPEAKKLGIPMGAAAFEYRDLIERNRVIALTCNFTLYADLSARVMQIIEEAFAEVEVYSIDEAFIRLDRSDTVERVRELRARLLQWTGIPVSIGLAPTKTLAKLATDHAKKGSHVFKLEDPEQIKTILRETPLQDIWGIGKGISDTLRRQGLYTALDFIQMDEAWIRRHLGVVGLRMALELNGMPCFTTQEHVPIKKSIICSRSFTEPLTEFDVVAEAASSFVAHAAEKLRSQDSVASFVEVYIRNSPFKEEGYYANRILIRLPEPTDYTPLLLHYMKEGLKQIFKPGILYKKVGIMLGDFRSKSHYQHNLFETAPAEKEKQTVIMNLMDQLNHSIGKKTLFLASEGTHSYRTHRGGGGSQAFTSDWDHLLKVKAC